MNFSYIPRDPSLTSETYHCKKVVNQLFSQNSHIFNPNLFSADDLSYSSERDVFPVAIHCVVEESSDGKYIHIIAWHIELLQFKDILSRL